MRLACAMRRIGAGRETILAAIRAENERRCVPPKEDAHLRALAKDIVGRYPPGARRDERRRGPLRPRADAAFDRQLSAVSASSESLAWSTSSSGGCSCRTRARSSPSSAPSPPTGSTVTHSGY